MTHPNRALRRLARLCGVAPVWRDATGVVRTVEPDALHAVLAALDVDATHPDDAQRALRAERDAELLPPVAVAWDAAPVRLPLRPPPGASTIDLVLATWDPEHGRGAELGAWAIPVESLPIPRSRAHLTPHAPAPSSPAAWTLPLDLAPGWYLVEARAGPAAAETRVIAAPRLLPALSRGAGLFAPLSELHDARTQRVGGFREGLRLARWAGGLGLNRLALLPITAGDEVDASPYSPISRRHFHERYVDLAALPELAACPAARAILESDAVREDLAHLRSRGAARDATIDPACASRLAQRVLLPCSAAVRGERAAALESFLREHPEVDAYARWRAQRDAAGDPAVAAMHRYAQWTCHAELDALARGAREAGVGLLLDVPLGVRGDGFDVASAPHAFVRGASAGAPPDALFRGGQTWGFPPPHPRGARAEGHRDVALAVRAHARYASAIRLDHVMSFLRLWVVPNGGGAQDGAYVRYPMEEITAAIALEASRAGCAVVGEDLGTVPDAVRGMMEAHGMHRLAVLPFVLGADDPERATALERLPERAVLSLNTHDLPPFASYWTARDLDEHAERGELDADTLDDERRARARFRGAWRAELERRGLIPRDERLPDDPADLPRVLSASLRALCDAPPAQVLIALDDLLLDVRRHNAPGTVRRENWRLRARRSLEELEGAPEPARELRALARRRAQPARETLDPHADPARPI